jgi:metallo-beta-lactamase class B
MEQAMFGERFMAAMLTASLITSCAPQSSQAPVAMKTLETIKTACGERDGWSDPAPPAHVFGNVYMVGTCGITSLLITTPNGHFLIDGATDKAADGIAENIRKLGFKPEDVKLLLITHEHLDHAGGISRLKQITQSKFTARQPALAAMASGLPQADDPQHGLHPAFPGVQGDFLLGDGDTLRLGDQVMTAIATPGHSPGGTSYIWKSCNKETCRNIVYADSLNAVSTDAYRFSDHPAYVATLRSSMAKIEAIKDCDIMISPHPFQSEFFERLAGEKPLVDADRCKQYVTAARARLDSRLAKEAAE